MNRRLLLLPAALLVAASCSSGDRTSVADPQRAPGPVPASLISDGAHSDGTEGFFFLPPMVSNPNAAGTLDSDLASVAPVVAICDVTSGADVECGASAPGASPAVRTFSLTSDPAITIVDGKYKVDWDTGEEGFAAGRLYRVHVFAGPARIELGFADVLLTPNPGHVKNTDGQIIALKDGRTLPIHFRIEEGVVQQAGPAVSLELTGVPASLPSGAMASLTVTARDQSGNVAAGYRGTIAFTSSDAHATLPAEFTFTEGDAGTHTFSNAVAFTTTGTKTVRATDAADASIFGEASLIVTPLDATTLEVSGLIDPFPAGGTSGITVTARDPNGNIATGYTGTIEFTSTDPQGTLPPNHTFTAADAGVHVFSASVTLRTAGISTVTATDQATNTITGSQTVTVSAGAAVRLVLAGAPEQTAAGVVHTITITARDASGNVASGYRGSIVFTSSDPGATLPPQYTFTEDDAGTHTFADAITFATAGAQTLRASDAADAAIFGEAPVTVIGGAAATLEVTGLSDPTPAGTPGAVTVTARDANGNIATGYTGTIAFTSSDPQATLPPNFTFAAADAGVRSFPASVTLRTAGSVTVTATDIAANTITGAQTVTVTPAAAAVLMLAGIPQQTVAGTAYDLSVTARDQFGNTATGYTGTVSFSSSDAAATIPSPYAFQSGDAGAHTFTGGVTFRTAGAQTLQATDVGAPALTASVATTVAPGAASQLRFTAQPSDAREGVAIAPPVAVTAYDAFGNQATTFAGVIRVAIGTNPSGGILFGTFDVAAASGVATYNDLAIAPGGMGYTLVASSAGLTGATSDPFDIIAIDVHWINAAGGAWSVGSNWSSGAAPMADQNALIDLAGTYTVTLDVNPSVHSVVLGAASGIQSLTASGRTLSVASAASVLSAGRMTLTNSTLTAGTLAIASGGMLTLTLTNTINAAVVNAGTIQLGSGSFASSSTVTGTLTTVAGSLVRVQAGGSNSTVLAVNNDVTNHGTIELTKVLDAVGAATLAVGGTLTNAANGFIKSLVGSGGDRTLSAQINNQGTLAVEHPLRIDRASTDHLNAGTIDVIGGNLTIAQTGNTPSFTNTGAITVPAGRTVVMTGGSFTQAAGATLSGGGGMSLSLVNPANFESAVGLSALALSNVAATFATDLTTETLALSINFSTVNGSGTLTNAEARTLPFTGSVLNMNLVNLGTMLIGSTASGNSFLNGAVTTAASSLIRVTSTVSNSSNLTVLTGFTNHGRIELTKTGDAFGTAAFTVSNGTLVNAPDGRIEVVAGTGGARALGAQLDNQGTVTLGHPLTISRSGADHMNSGSIILNNGSLALQQSGVSPSFTNTGTITIGEPWTWTITGGSLTQASGATLNGGGSLVLSSVNPAVFETTFTLRALTLASTVATFATDIATPALGLSLTSSTLSGAGTLTNAAGRLITLQLANTVNISVANAGSIQLGVGNFSSTSSLTGTLTTEPGSLVRVQAGQSNSSTLTVTNGFTNHGTIELTKVSDQFGSSALVVSNGTLVNAPDGTIRSVAGAGGGRALTAQLDNQGTVNVLHALSINRASAAHTNSGTMNVTGGDVSISQSGTSQSFTNSGVVDVASTRAMRIGSAAVVNAAGGMIQGAGTFEAGTSAPLTNGGSVTVALARLATSLSSTGSFAPTTVEFFGPMTIPVGVGYSYNNVRLLSAAGFAGSVSMTGDLTVAGTAHLVIGAHEVAVGGDFATQSGSLLTMQSPASVLAVAGDASFGGAGTNGRLIAGTLRVGGNFAQSGNAAAFAASGSHVTVLNGSGPQSVSFANPGTTTVLSHFQHLEIENASAAGVTLGSAVFANGQLRTPAGSASRTLTSAGRALQVGGLDAAGLVFDNTLLRVVNGDAITRFDDGIFRNFDPTATQLRLDRASGDVTFNSVDFQTEPTTGFYLHLVDTDPVASLFTVTMQTTQPPAHGGKVFESVSGQLLGWPATIAP